MESHRVCGFLFENDDHLKEKIETLYSELKELFVYYLFLPKMSTAKETADESSGMISSLIEMNRVGVLLLGECVNEDKRKKSRKKP